MAPSLLRKSSQTHADIHNRPAGVLVRSMMRNLEHGDRNGRTALPRIISSIHEMPIPGRGLAQACPLPVLHRTTSSTHEMPIQGQGLAQACPLPASPPAIPPSPMLPVPRRTPWHTLPPPDLAPRTPSSLRSNSVPDQPPMGHRSSRSFLPKSTMRLSSKSSRPT